MDEDLVAFAVGLATRAGDLAAHMFLAGTPRTHKPDGTEVTAADIAVEELIRTEIARYAPDDGVLGEEFGEAPGRSGRRWVTDPISGTGYFTRRMPLFATLLAVEDAHGPAVAVIDQPMQRELVFAVRGGGCHVLTDRATDPRAAHRARVSARPDAAGALTLTANQHAWSDALMRALHPRVALVGAIHHGAVHVATGRVDALVMTHQGYDDRAVLPLVVAEAGAVVSDLDGGPVLTGDGTVLAANPAVHAGLLAHTAGVPAIRGSKVLR
jgi:histidinol-phosphatase